MFSRWQQIDNKNPVLIILKWYGCLIHCGYRQPFFLFYSYLFLITTVYITVPSSVFLSLQQVGNLVSTLHIRRKTKPEDECTYKACRKTVQSRGNQGRVSKNQKFVKKEIFGGTVKWKSMIMQYWQIMEQDLGLNCRVWYGSHLDFYTWIRSIALYS